MSLYYVPWILLVIGSLWAGLGGFLWALRTGQFADQERARYLALRGEATSPEPDRRSASAETWAMAALLGVGGLVILSLAAIVLRHAAWGVR